MRLKTLFFGLILLCFATSAFTGEEGPKPHDYFLSMSVGPSWTNPGSTQSIALQPDIINTYVPQNSSNTSTLVNGEIVLGVQAHILQDIQSQFGLAFYASSPETLNGYIQVDGDPNFQNYADQYKIDHEHIALKSKWSFENASNINPYLSGSIGVGFNRSYGYSITPLIFPAVPMPPFKSNTQVALSYTLGAGFQHALSEHIAIAIGYQFVSWGSSHLAPANGQTSPQGLSLNNVYTQGIEFNLTYLL
jgi:opacity protein-like surface antigen